MPVLVAGGLYALSVDHSRLRAPPARPSAELCQPDLHRWPNPHWPPHSLPTGRSERRAEELQPRPWAAPSYRQHRARAAVATSSAAGRLWSEPNRPHGGTRQARVSDLELTEPIAGDSDRFGSDRLQDFCSSCARAAALQVTAPNSVARRRCVLRAERFPYTGRELPCPPSHSPFTNHR